MEGFGIDLEFVECVLLADFSSRRSSPPHLVKRQNALEFFLKGRRGIANTV